VDNLFIAIDAEDMLRKLGAGAVDVVRSVSDALALLSERSFTFALLDVKLGDETSLPIAHALKANNIPFAFGTGYDETLAAADIKMNVPIVAKPYHRATMVEALAALIAITPVLSHAVRGSQA
jgi:ActR/RegA family two-component response regulator